MIQNKDKQNLAKGGWVVFFPVRWKIMCYKKAHKFQHNEKKNRSKRILLQLSVWNFSANIRTILKTV